MEIINDNGVDKLVNNGKVAVLFSPGWGAGWSTWCHEDSNRRRMMFDPAMASCIVRYTAKVKVSASDAFYAEMHEELERIAEEHYPDEYAGGLEGLRIAWVSRGVQFRINEFDGNEQVEVNEDSLWEVA